MDNIRVATVPRPSDARLESPSENSAESGIAVIRGWVCNADKVEIEIDDGDRLEAGYGTTRPDTAAACDNDGNNGFGLTINWGRFEEGPHNLRALADGVEFADVVFHVTHYGVEYLEGAAPAEVEVENFPTAAESVFLRWDEAHQNFMVIERSPM